MPKMKSWEQSVEEIQGSLQDAFDRFMEPYRKYTAEFLCYVYGHVPRAMNPVVKRGTTDAAGGSDLTRYIPYYCVRCQEKWRDHGQTK